MVSKRRVFVVVIRIEKGSTKNVRDEGLVGDDPAYYYSVTELYSDVNFIDADNKLHNLYTVYSIGLVQGKYRKRITAHDGNQRKRTYRTRWRGKNTALRRSALRQSAACLNIKRSFSLATFVSSSTRGNL